MELLQELKTYLEITWEDTHTDQKLTGILGRAKQILCGSAGAELTFADDTAERQLLLDLCRYIWNNAGEDFEENYRADLIMLRAKYQTGGDAVESEKTDSGTGG